MSKFKESFLIGAATAAHQVEGNNIHSDYWAMEHMKHTSFNEPSLAAVDHYNRYEEDIKYLANAGCNAYRFSIEWARIEPLEGQYDDKEIEHYRNVLKCCLDNGIKPIVTLMHFTSPVWVITQGGWESEKTVEAFVKYCEYVVSKLGEYMEYIVTINEANMGIQVARIAERYKKQMMEARKNKSKNTDVEGQAQVGMNFNSMLKNMLFQRFENKKIFKTSSPQNFVSARTDDGDMLVIEAHLKAKKAMKAIKPELKVGISLSLHDIQSVDGGEENAIREWRDEFTHYLPYILEDDFFGLQNYSREIIGSEGQIVPKPGTVCTQMGYELYPKALGNVIRRVDKEFKDNGVTMPIMVTENGVATSDDSVRVKFIDEATDGVLSAINDGADVIGYMYWSLLDNFEWQKGFSMTFGLIAVDRESMVRKPKESLTFLGSL